MATVSNGIPEGNKAPLITLDDNHHGSWLVICSAFGLVIILLTLIIRIYLRYRVSPPFAADDIALTISTALAVIQCSLVFAGVSKGDGTSIDLIDEDNLVAIQKFYYASNIFYIFALYASKICVVLLFKRISSGIVQKKLAWIALGIVTLTGFISLFLCALRCNLSEPWIIFNTECNALFDQWRAIVALDIAIEVGLFSMVVYMVWGLQTAASNKTRVIFAFGLRLPVIATAALQIHYQGQKLHSENPTLDGVAATICRQTEIFYAIMASTIPCLRPFLASFFTGFGAMGGETVIAGSQIGSHSGNSRGEKGGSYALDSLQSSGGDSSSAAGKKSGNSSNNKRRSRTGQTTVGAYVRDRDNHHRERDNFGNNRQNRAQISHEPASTLPLPPRATTPSSFSTAAAAGNPSSKHSSTMLTMMGGSGQGLAAADASSIASNESQRMIIKKEVQWYVDSEKGDGGCGVPRGL